MWQHILTILTLHRNTGRRGLTPPAAPRIDLTGEDRAAIPLPAPPPAPLSHIHMAGPGTTVAARYGRL